MDKYHRIFAPELWQVKFLRQWLVIFNILSTFISQISLSFRHVIPCAVMAVTGCATWTGSVTVSTWMTRDTWWYDPEHKTTFSPLEGEAGPGSTQGKLPTYPCRYFSVQFCLIFLGKMFTEDVVERVNRSYLIYLGKYFKIFLSSLEQRSVNLQEIVLNKNANLGHQNQTITKTQKWTTPKIPDIHGELSQNWWQKVRPRANIRTMCSGE